MDLAESVQILCFSLFFDTLSIINILFCFSLFMDRIYPYKREWDKGGGRMKYDTCLIKTDSLDQILQFEIPAG